MNPGMPVFDTVTDTAVATALLPAPSRARADTVCAPLLAVCVLHANVYTGPAPVSSAPRFAPSRRSWTPATATLSDAVTLMVTWPLTVAPVAGALIATDGGWVSEVTVAAASFDGALR